MWWNGLPPSIRGRLWDLAIPNELNVTKDLFEIFAQHAKSAREQLFSSKKFKKEMTTSRSNQDNQSIDNKKDVPVDTPIELSNQQVSNSFYYFIL